MSAELSVPLPIKLIAATCALGMGMVAVATALSSSPSFLLIMIASMVMNYGTVFFNSWFNHFFGNKTFSENSQSDYLQKVLKNKAKLSQISSKYAGALDARHALGIAFASVLAAGALAVAAYFTFLYFVPAAVLLYSVATALFFPVVFVVYRAFRRGIEDVWLDMSKVLNGGSLNHPVSTDSPRNTPRWKFIKSMFIVVGALSCVAGGILTAALIQEGVATTTASAFTLIGGGLSFLTGPIGWAMFSLLFVCVAGMMARSVMMFIKDDSLDEKVKLKHALFDRKAYLQDLENDWVKLNSAIEKTQDSIKQLNFGQDSNTQLSEEYKSHLATLDELYGKKDTLYHRHNLFTKPWFQPLFTGITVIMSLVCLLGMLAHMARGSQAGVDMITHVSSASEKLAMAIAEGIMWVGLVAESVFTVTNVTDTLIEEGIGTQTSQYEQKLATQETRKEAISRFAYPSSRAQHAILDFTLVANGASGHPTKTGYAFADALGPVGESAAAIRSGTERDPAQLFYRWNYGSDSQKTLLEPLDNLPELGNSKLIP